MKQYIKFLKFLWMLFIVPAVGGMVTNPDLKYGLTRNMINEDAKFIESMEMKAVKESLGINEINSSKDAENLAREVFKTVNKIKWYNYAAGMNFLFWKGTTYLNGLIPTGCGKFWLNKSRLNRRKKSYRIIQLYEILGYKDKRDEIEAAEKITSCIPLLRDSMYFPIKSFWDEAKKRERSTEDLLNEYLHRYTPKYHNLLKLEAEYIDLLNILGVNITTLSDGEKGLLSSFNEAENKIRDLMKRYLEAFGKYISFLDPDNGNSFLEELASMSDLPKHKSYMVEARNLWTKKKYNLYTHTERMTQYLRKRDGILSEPFYAVSYYDPCTDSDPLTDHCEQMFAKTTPEELTQKRKHSEEEDVTTETEKHYRPNAIIISGRPYGSRNSDIRQARENSDLVNHSVWLYQLSPESYQIN